MGRGGMRFYFHTASVFALAVTFNPVTAFAQLPSPSAPQPGGENAGAAATDDIVVTARRKAEAIQSTPVAVTAFSQKLIDERSIRTPLELSKAVPGLQTVTTPGQSTNVSFAIRGRGTNYGAAAGSVETYFADVPLSPPFQRPTLPPQFFDLASFQVLKGPQGTLFGRSTTGGAVLIVPAAPEIGSIGGYSRLQIGNYNNVQAEAAINIPLGDEAALRLAAFGWSRKGYNRTIGGATDAFGKVLPSQRVDNQDVYELRASLLVEPAEGLSNTTIFTYHSDHNLGSMTTTTLRSGVFGVGSDPNAPIPTTAVGLPAVGPHVLDTDVDLADRGRSRIWAVINTTTLTLADELTLKNIFGYIHARDYTDGPFDSDGTRIAGIDLFGRRPMKNKQLTEELQLQGSLADGKADFIFGGLLDITHNPHGRDKMNLYVLSYPNGGAGFSHQWLDTNFNAKSIFGSITGHLNDKLSVTVGGRYAHEKVHQVRADVVIPPATYFADPDAFLTVPASVPLTVDNASFNGKTYNAGLEYKASDATLVYGGYRRGWKRGGFNTSPPNPSVALYGPEKDDDFYLGLKQDLRPLGLAGHFNIEGFYDIYYGAQNSYLTIRPGLGLAVVVDNAEKQIFRGFDMDFEVKATRWLDLLGNYTFVDSDIKKWTDRSVIDPAILAMLPDPSTDLSGNPVPYVSKHKFALSARLHHELADGSELVAIPTVSYQSKFFNFANATRVTNSAALFFNGGRQLNMDSYGVAVIDGYSLVDLRLEWNKIGGSSVNLALNANNLFNKNYIAGGNGSVYLFGFEQTVWGAPRMVTLEAKITF